MPGAILGSDMKKAIDDFMDYIKKLGPRMVDAFKEAFTPMLDWFKGRWNAIWGALGFGTPFPDVTGGDAAGGGAAGGAGAGGSSPAPGFGGVRHGAQGCGGGLGGVAGLHILIRQYSVRHPAAYLRARPLSKLHQTGSYSSGDRPGCRSPGSSQRGLTWLLHKGDRSRRRRRNLVWAVPASLQIEQAWVHLTWPRRRVHRPHRSRRSHNRETWKAQVDFSLDEAAKGGWGPWHGAANTGIGRRQGLAGAHAIGINSSSATKHSHVDLSNRARAAHVSHDSHAVSNNHSNEVHVGSVHVHTPSTDVPGIAGSIGPAIEESFLTTQADYGLA